MPGFLKVDGSQKPIAVPWLKESGTWKPVAIGYIKVDGTWRIWYTAEVVDDFNRADNSSLGTASDDFSEWNQFTDGWSIVNNAAEHDGGAGPDIAAVQMYKATNDVIVEADLVDGTGLGVAFWVLDNQNWWAAIPGRRTQSNPGFYSCPSGFNLEGTVCRRVTVYSASYEADQTIDPPPYQQAIYGCPSGGNLSGRTCFVTSTYAASNNPETIRTCPSGYSGPSSTGRCSKPRSERYSTSCVGLGCRTSTCNGPGVSCSGSCTNTSAGGLPGCNCRRCTRTCSCSPGGGSCPCYGNDIVFASTRTVNNYSCNSGDSRSGRTCTTTSSYSASITGYRTVDPAPYVKKGRGWYCPQGGQLSGTTCTLTELQNASYTPPYNTYPSVVRIYKSVLGVISQEYISDVSSDPNSMKVETSGNNINIKLYSQPQVQGSSYASKTFQSSNANKATGAGIAKYNNQARNQGTRLDNFRAE